MPGGGEIGQAWWEADLKDEKLKAKLRELDQLLRQQGQAAEKALNRGWAASIENAGASLGRLGGRMQSVGNSLTANLTVPILGLGAATSKMGLDFDTTLRQIVGLTDVTQDQIGGIRQELLKLAPEVGKGPQELAEAFYFVASAGFTADEALDVLETSAKAAAAGLGETQSVAQVLGSVINAYGKENITAARAADILVEAISQGTAEAPEFASVIGRVAPTAAALGVTFDQVAASLAGMTLTGLSAEESATSLNQVFVSLLKPTVQAEGAMSDLGLSAEGLRKQLREEGLLTTLRTLEERFAGNEEAAAAVFGNVRALRGVTSLLTLDSEQLNSVFGKVDDSLGRLQQGYEDTEGPQRDIDRAMADLRVTAIELGEDVLPVMVDVLQELAGGARELADWWRSLDDDTKKFVVQMAAVIAVAGPLIRILGTLTSGFGGLLKAVGFLAGEKGIPKLIGWIKAVGPAVTSALGPLALFFAAVSMTDEVDKATGGLWNLYGTMERLKRDIPGFADEWEEVAQRTGLSTQEFIAAADEALSSGAMTWDEFVRDITNGAMVTLNDALNQSGEDWESYQEQISGAAEKGAADAAASLNNLPPDVKAALEAAGVVVDDTAPEAMDGVSEEAAKQRDLALQAMKDMLAGMANMFETDESVHDAWQALIDRMDDPYTEAERKADIFGQDTVNGIRRGLATNDPGLIGDVIAQVNRLLGEIALMEPGALETGEAVPPALREGMDAQMQALITWIGENVQGPSLDAMSLEDAQKAGVEGIWLYAQGMRQNRLEAVRAAQSVAGQVKAALQFDASAGGRSIVSTWLNGMQTAYRGEVWKIEGIVGHAANLYGRSLPRIGPLTRPDKGGRSIMETWLGGQVDAYDAGIGAVHARMDALRAAMTATATGATFQASVDALAPQPAIGVDGDVPRGTVVYHREVHLHTEGPTPAKTEDDLTRLLDRTQWVAEDGAWGNG